MKHIQNSIICFFALFVLFITHANGQQIKRHGYLINGTIKGIDSGSIRMLTINGDAILDSSVIVNNRFEMKGTIGLPERRLFNIEPGNWSFKAFVENGIITLGIDTTGAQHYGHGSNTWALIWEIEETGSKLSEVCKRYNNDTKLQYYLSVLSSLNEKLKTAKDNKDVVSNIEQEMDSVKQLVLSGQKLWIENYISEHPASIAGVYLFNEFYNQAPTNISLNDLHSTLDKFSGPAKTSVYYKELAGATVNLDHIQVNAIAPDFTLLKRDKTTFTLSATRGSYTLIDFWASWCAPCRSAIPHWKKVYSRYHQKGLNIVSVADDRYWNYWIKALGKEQMPWVQVIDEFPDNGPGRVGELFALKTLPFYVLLDKEGNVILSSGDEDLVTKKIKDILQ